MTTPQINIASLDFNGIKSSLKSYLQTKSEFSGYDFNASGLNALLDIFAYNTLYYAFYANMIANETFLDTAKLEKNLVSLVKPLGYLVPSKTSSKTELVVTPFSGYSEVTLTAYTNYFIGTDLNGVSYRFYPTKTITLNSGVNTPITLYEASTVVNNLPISVDIDNQKAFLSNTNVDIETLTVKVNGVEWSKYNTYSPSYDPQGRVYFLDRTSNGFYLIFGKRTLNDYQTELGKNIEPTDTVTVSYLIPTGESANNIASYSNSNNLTIVSSATSGSGKNGPDTDLIKFFAPKLLASNDRAITKDDYYGLLLGSNLLPAGIDSKEKINIWGGEEGDPASYGRVFISFSNPTLTAESQSVKTPIQLLKNKSILTVVPEYIQSQNVQVLIDVNIGGIKADQTTGIQTYINNIYNENVIFNNAVVSNKLLSDLLGVYPNITSLTVSKASLAFNIIGSEGEKVLFYKNPIKIMTGTTRGINSSLFTYTKNGISYEIILKDLNTPSTTKGTLYAYNSSGGIITALGSLGTVDYTAGIVKINQNIIATGTTVTLTAEVENLNNIIIKDEYLANVTSTVTRI